MDLREIGTMLREERERQGLSLDTVSDKTKISRSCLAAIEDGNESFLPHPVYAKGFIKNYAKLLGLDQGDFTSRLSSLYPVEEATQFRDISLDADIPDDTCNCSVSSAAPRPPLLLWLAGAGAVVLVLGLGWYLFAHVFSGSGEEAVQKTAETVEPSPVQPSPPAAYEPPAPPAPVASAPAAPTPPAPVPTPAATAVPTAVTPTVPPTGTAAPVEVAKTLPEPAPKAVPTAEDKATQDIAVSGPAAPAPAVPPAPELAAATPAAKTFTVGETGPHVVTIAAHERCWLQAGADGGAMHESMLEKGDSFTGRFTDYLLVRLGNAGAVEIHFDNKLYPLQAGKGAVKTLKFVAKKTDQPASGTVPTPTSTAPAPAPAAVASVPVTPSSPGLPGIAPAVAAPSAEGAAGAKEVEIYGQDGSWVIVSPDKGPAKEIYVKKGQRITVPFGEKIEIKLGNPSSVVFRYNGQETPVTTEKGAVKTIRFPQEAAGR
jgi:cytoskeleton protein RodZ